MMSKLHNTTPRIKKKIHEFSAHDDKWNDEYHWLKDSNWPNVRDKEIINVLDEENYYYNSVLSPLEPTIAKIENEIAAKIEAQDSTVPYLENQYFYHSYIEPNQEYWTHVRTYLSLDAKQEILLDENLLASEVPYFSLGNLAVSPNQKMLAYSYDIEGNEHYHINIKDIKKCIIYDQDVIRNTMPVVIWHQSNLGFFYIPADTELLATKVYYHVLGSKQQNDVLIYEEKDKTFSVNIFSSADKEYIFIESSSADVKEIFVMKSNDLTMKLTKLLSRDYTIWAQIEHRKGAFYLLLNDKGPNMRLVKIKEDHYPCHKDNIKDLMPHNESIYLIDIIPFESALVVLCKKGGLDKILILFNNNDETLIKEINFSDDTYAVDLCFSPYSSNELRYSYSSLAQPSTVYACDISNINNITQNIIKSSKISLNFAKYKIERLYALSSDQKKIPISLIYNLDLKRENMPLLLYAYGSYGISIPANFQGSIFSLIDRGFIYAIAHVRGGDDLGRSWYEDAKMFKKKTTFTDFLAVAKHLVDMKYTMKGNIVAHGGSAGGMLVGACLNMEPDLFLAVLSDVPFVDVLCTMLDEKLPLTPGEYKEWGNPSLDPLAFNYIRSYSPYDNIGDFFYPSILATCGLTDPRVGYWEAVKWVAKLREKNRNNQSKILLKINMEAGHAGKSGRYQRIRERAEQYAFILSCLKNRKMHR